MLIHTDRLTLRRWREEDIEPLSVINSDPLVMQWLGSGPIDREKTALYIERNDRFFDTHGFGIWAVGLRAERRLIGFSGVRPFARPGHPMSPCVEAAWRQARTAWGCGYATEAARAAIVDAFERCGVSEIAAWTPVLNTRSQALMRRLQMNRRSERDFDAPRLPVGHPLRPHVVYELRRTSGR
jgi:RimJ/RimL family protein N-acetyltransferase